MTIYALVDCWNSADDEVRGLPRLAWLLVVLLFPLVGGLAYLATGREQRDRPHPGRPRIVAPDDDPEFLRTLDQQRRRAAAEEERRHEQQLRKEHKEREKTERKERNERQGDHDGEDSGHPTS